MCTVCTITQATHATFKLFVQYYVYKGLFSLTYTIGRVTRQTVVTSTTIDSWGGRQTHRKISIIINNVQWYRDPIPTLAASVTYYPPSAKIGIGDCNISKVGGLYVHAHSTPNS